MPTVTENTLLHNLSYDDMVFWAQQNSSGSLDDWLAAVNQYDVDELEAAEQYFGNAMNYYKNGDGTYSIISFNNNFQNTVQTLPDSNVSEISRGSFSQMLNRAKDSVTDKLNVTRFPASGGLGAQASYVVGSVASGVGAVSTGIALGKTIDSALYNLNPDFWDSHGMSTLNPETWNSITNGDDSPAAGLFNMILGLDPTTGKSQAYIDENALAYFAYYMKENGVFATGSTTVDSVPDGLGLPSQYYPLNVGGTAKIIQNVYNKYYLFIFNNSVVAYDGNSSKNGVGKICGFSNTYSQNLEIGVMYEYNSGGTLLNTTTLYVSATNSYTYDSKIVFYGEYSINYQQGSNSDEWPNPYSKYYGSSTATMAKVAWAALYSATTTSPLPGVSNQSGATLPDVSSWNSIPNTLQSLKNQYPDMWNDAVTWDNVQPDGTNPQLTYVPVPMPQTTSALDTQPVSGIATQAQPQIDPTTFTDQLLKVITSIATHPEPQTQTQIETDIPPQNPVDVGTGTTPSVPSPTGSATALWSVYHPTKAQIDSFGAWLWGSPFLTNIGKLFQNPIEGVISLHKIFATPVDAGVQNIVVGTLDSNVASQTVTEQYVTVDCGNVDCHEYFGNVFDYSPHTSVNLYLPFIGIVPLDVDDVMRSTIHVVYGVDVFTGACLAMVEVKRDSCTVNMYQYSGCASVEYPLSNIQHAQLINAIIGVGGAIGTIAATGGAMTPMVAAGTAIGAASGLAAGGKANVGRSGGFSGNAGAMGIKKPYLIIQRPQTKVATTFPRLDGYPNNLSVRLGDCSNHVKCRTVHVNGINATRSELEQIEMLLKEGVEI